MKTLLKLIEENEKIPFHMPGHKRNIDSFDFLKKLAANLDITEIDGFDNLANPKEVLDVYMKKAALLWKAKKSFFLVGGSTCGILAGFRTLCKEGETVLMTRNSHKSVYHAVEILGLNIIFLKSEIYNSAGLSSDFDLENLRATLEQNKNISTVFVTSPSYEGYILPIKDIAAICHEHSVKLMVDEAHGSHLGFTDYFAGSAVKSGADLVVQSLHKTLLGMTQTAILHINNDIDEEKTLKNINIFQTSSPSYILMSSICSCIDCLENLEMFKNWENILEHFYEKTKNLRKLKIVNVNDKDKSKIIINTSCSDIDGQALMSLLRDEHKIELEMAYGDMALAMTGLGDTADSIEKLIKALFAIDEKINFTQKEIYSYKSFDSKPICSIKKAMENFGENQKLEKNEIFGKYLWVYPPGIPLLVPGEEIGENLLEIIEKLEKSSVQIKIL